MRLAREAGAIIRAFYEVPPTVRWKDPTEPVTEADRAVNSISSSSWLSAFRRWQCWRKNRRMILSRLDKRRVWIVDPLDGTAEFIAHNGEFVIMIGLAVQGEPVVGVVYPAHRRRTLRRLAWIQAPSWRSSESARALQCE